MREVRLGIVRVLPDEQPLSSVPRDAVGEPVRGHALAAGHLRDAFQQVQEGAWASVPGALQVASGGARAALAGPCRLHPPEPGQGGAELCRRDRQVSVDVAESISEAEGKAVVLRLLLDGLFRGLRRQQGRLGPLYIPFEAELFGRFEGDRGAGQEDVQRLGAGLFGFQAGGRG